MRPIDADALKYEPLPKDERNYRTYNLDDAYEDGYNDAFVDVRNAPTIDAEPVRHGKFIGTESDGYADGYPVYYEWKCSECGCIFEEDEPTYRYCPNCGARMDAERKEK